VKPFDPRPEDANQRCRACGSWSLGACTCPAARTARALERIAEILAGFAERGFDVRGYVDSRPSTTSKER
jgi:hypothetical protein